MKYLATEYDLDRFSSGIRMYSHKWANTKMFEFSVKT